MVFRPASWVLKVVKVSSARDEVSIFPPIAIRFSLVSNCAPPARQAVTPNTFCALRLAACAQIYSNATNLWTNVLDTDPSFI